MQLRHALITTACLLACMPCGSAFAQPSSHPAPSLSLDGGDKVMIRLALIPAGKFKMGSPETEIGHRKNETLHEVTISKPFYMSLTHITVGQFEAFAKANQYQTEAEIADSSEGFEISNGKLTTKKIRGVSWRNVGFDQGLDHPVVYVSWNDACAYCAWLSTKTGKTARLPTEAEWEYACRAGTNSAWPWGDLADAGEGWANCADQSLKSRLPKVGNAIQFFNWADGFAFTAPVGRFKPNAFGLYDMIGNAAHWCQDRYGDYGTAAVTDPTGTDVGLRRIIRGGSWNNFVPLNCRSAARCNFPPNFRNERYGFRIVVETK